VGIWALRAPKNAGYEASNVDLRMDLSVWKGDLPWFRVQYFIYMCSGSEAGSYLKGSRTFLTLNTWLESNKEEEDKIALLRRKGTCRRDGRLREGAPAMVTVARFSARLSAGPDSPAV